MSSEEDDMVEHTREQVAARDAHTAAQKTREENKHRRQRDESKEGHGVRMLYVLVHGNNGQPTDWNFLKERLRRIFGISALVMVSTSNSHSTHDGIEIGGLNLAIEIASTVLEFFKKGIDTSAAQQYTEFLQSCMGKTSSSGNLSRGKKKGNQSSPSLPSVTTDVAEESKGVGAEEETVTSLTKVVGEYCEEVERRKKRLRDIAKEVREISEKMGQRLAFTIIGHSLGGLYSRNCIAHLLEVGLLGPGRAKQGDTLEELTLERAQAEHKSVKRDVENALAEENGSKEKYTAEGRSDEEDHPGEESEEEREGVAENGGQGMEKEKKSEQSEADRDAKEEREETEEREDDSEAEIGAKEREIKDLSGWRPLIAAGYMSVTSPHLGSRRPGGTMVRNTWKTLVHAVLNNKNGLTGFELLLEDNTDPENKEQAPLLVRMSDPSDVYLKALRMFYTTTALGITHYDAMVPYCSAAMTAVNPYPPPSRPGFAVVGSSGFGGAHLEQIDIFGLPETKGIASSSASDSDSETSPDISSPTAKPLTKKKSAARMPRIPLASFVPQSQGEGSDKEEGGSLSSSSSSVTNDHSIAAARGTTPSIGVALERKHSHPSIVGVRSPNRKTDQYLADTSMAVEFLPEMLKGLQTIPWR